ncbi:hypothetical protein GCM10023215_41010 [Pseudonocardia yuanmonensis]|uniref:MYXO-CTERM domain-containing protein n=1 Tax=Pseudonocardia yuanmonensis TaxID=1095914 RepID=A0ABP8WZZ3_9PSEU
MSRLVAEIRRRLLDRILFGPRRARAAGPGLRPHGGVRPRTRVGFWGPVPFVSTRTRRGSEVSVGGCGCCLPIPLLTVLGLVTAVWATCRRQWRR